jgi:hypothetical protein
VFRDQAYASDRRAHRDHERRGRRVGHVHRDGPSYGEGGRWEDLESWYVNVEPTGPEAGEIYGQETILVFPSAYHSGRPGP